MSAVAAPTHPVVDALVGAINVGDADAFAARFTEAFTGEDVAAHRPYRGRRGAGACVRGYLEAFPDLHVRVMQVLSCEPHVAVVWEATGTHRGAWLRIPATGKPVRVVGMTVLELEGDLVRRSRSIWDVAGALRDLGLLPRLPG